MNFSKIETGLQIFHNLLGRKTERLSLPISREGIQCALSTKPNAEAFQDKYLKIFDPFEKSFEYRSKISRLAVLLVLLEESRQL